MLKNAPSMVNATPVSGSSEMSALIIVSARRAGKKTQYPTSSRPRHISSGTT